MNQVPVGREARKIELLHGGHLHCIEQGQGMPVVFLHGGMGDYTIWKPQLDALSPGYRCISVSRRYSWPNQNAFEGDHTVYEEARDIGGLLDALNLERACLVGSSYGAFAALAFALEHPGRVQALVLNEPPLHAWLQRWEEGRQAYKAFLEHHWEPAAHAFLAGETERALALQFEGICGSSAGDFASLPASRLQICLRNARSMEALARSAQPFTDLPRSVAAVLALPVLLVRGAQNSLIHRLVHEEMCRVIAHASECIVARASHGAPVENPQDFNSALLAFLRTLET